MEINGKTYRNLESQVGYLTDVAEQLDARITEVAAQIPSKMIVEELPETGDPLITYYVGPKGTEPNLYYEVWVWVQEEPDGPFVWRELEDTDQVDLSGYLEKQSGTSTYNQVYSKNSSGTQEMINVSAGIITDGIVRRNGQQIECTTPSQSYHAASKGYVDTNFLAKQTASTDTDQAYIKTFAGTQSVIDIYKGSATPNSLVRRTDAGRIHASSPSGNDGTEVVNVNYVSSNYMPLQKGATSTDQVYVKNADGTQGMANLSYASPTAWTIVRRNGSGNVICADPTQNDHAASKAYVDSVVGQLIYHHKMSITYTTVGTDYVAIAAHIDDNASTAYTDVNWHNMPLLVPDYAVYHYGGVDYMASVVKMPRTLHQDEFDEPQDGFMITYWNGSAYVNERINSTLFSTPTVTDVVTTW